MLSGVAFLQGLTIGLGLIIAIGPKDAFVIRQSLRGRHLFAMLAICVGSDIVLIMLGTAGLGSLVARYYWIMIVAVVGGSAFMYWHGVMALKAVFGNASMPSLEAGDAQTLRQVVIATSAMSFLNPLAILDSGLIVGAIGGTKPVVERMSFALGAMLASLIWFAILIGGARLVAPAFKRAVMWKVLDVLIAVIMFTMATVTLYGAFWPEAAR